MASLPKAGTVTYEEWLRMPATGYESIGAEEVWLVSPEAATVEVLQLQERKLRRAAILADGILKPKHFPFVHLDISQIWPD